MLIKLTNEIYVNPDDVVSAIVDPSINKVLVTMRVGDSHSIAPNYHERQGVYETLAKLVKLINDARGPM